MTDKQAYLMTPHAIERMRERRIKPMHVLRALTKRGTYMGRTGRIAHYDGPSQVIVVTDPQRNLIITVYRTGEARS